MKVTSSPPMSAEFKSIQSVLSIDEAEGIVECYAAAIGNKDSVGDIIIAGAFDASLKRRKPRVVWGHDWNHPIGKVLEIYEVRAGDPRLPLKMKVAGVGGLYARVQFNLNSQKGREAFSNILFFGLDHEWCADPDTEILTDRGWLRYDQVTTDDQAYVLNPETGWGQFEQIEAVNIFDAKPRQMRHIETGGFSSLTTGAHRWPIAANDNGGNVKWTTTSELRAQDRILRAAPRADAPELQKYDDAFVEAVGWFWTEGWVAKDAAFVGQSTEVNPQKVAAIRAAFQGAFPGNWSEAHSKDLMAHFRLTKAASAALLAVTGEAKEPSPEFLKNLTRAQLRLLIDICLDGDGHRSKSGQRTWCQVAEAGVRAFEMLCALAGQPTNTTSQKDYGNRFGRPPQRVSLLNSGVAKPLDASRVKSYGYKNGESRTVAVDEWVTTTDIVWCPTTASGTWLARRNGSVYFTGNSIGYKTLDAVYDPQRQANILKELELYEISPVLHGANQLTGTVSIKSDTADDRVDSFGKSKWPMFDREFAAMVKAKHPEIWDAGGNIKGDDQYEILTKIANQGGRATTDDQVEALELREAWIARHERDFLLPGVVAQMKWLAVGSRGQDHMKQVVRDAIERRSERESKDGAGYPSMDGDDYRDRLVAAIVAERGGSVELRQVSRNLVVFDHTVDGATSTMQVSYHFDGDQFMIGDPERVRAETVYLPVGDPGDPDASKAEIGVPQEAITGDILRGRGPRRGGLERLLRYWRPIMRKPGGFRRCLVILADHPELAPRLPNLCAWLHHETTGKWPNEGKRRLKGWDTGDDYDAKGWDSDNDGEDVTDEDLAHAYKVLDDFIKAETDFISYVSDDANWDGDPEDPKAGCGCGCADRKDADDDIAVKAGRVLSNKNMAKIRQALDLLNEVVAAAEPRVETKADNVGVIAAAVEELFDLKSFLDPIFEFHGADVVATPAGLVVKNYTALSTDAVDALANALGSTAKSCQVMSADKAIHVDG